LWQYESWYPQQEQQAHPSVPLSPWNQQQQPQCNQQQQQLWYQQQQQPWNQQQQPQCNQQQQSFIPQQQQAYHQQQQQQQQWYSSAPQQHQGYHGPQFSRGCDPISDSRRNRKMLEKRTSGVIFETMQKTQQMIERQQMTSTLDKITSTLLKQVTEPVTYKQESQESDDIDDDNNDK